MEAVRIRQRGAEDFVAYYESLCALEDTCPVASVRAGAKDGVLSCRVYKTKKNDWHPLLTALQINKALHTVVFIDKWEERVYPAVRKIDGVMYQRLAPAPHLRLGMPDKDTVCSIAKSIRGCLCVSSALKSLVFEGIHLQLKDCKCLAQASSPRNGEGPENGVLLLEVEVERYRSSKTPLNLRIYGLETEDESQNLIMVLFNAVALLKNTSLVHLSLKGSEIGNKAAEVLCNAVKSSCSLEWLDLTACSLSSQGASSVAALIKHHCLRRQNEAWKDSLRSQKLHLEKMPGLRRVTLNLNVDIGDKGAQEFVEALRDDVCLRAIDIQSCGITTEGAVSLLEVLKLNTCLIVLDLRANPLIDDDVVDSVYEQLSINVASVRDKDESYMWLEVEVERILQVVQSSRSIPGLKKITSRTVAPLRVRHSPHTKGCKRKNPPVRTLSSFQYKAHAYNVLVSAGEKHLEGMHDHDSASGTSLQSARSKKETSQGSLDSSNTAVISSEELRQLRVALINCHHKLKEESSGRAQAEARVAELELENQSLRKQLRLLQTSSHNELSGSQSSEKVITALDDDLMLETVEAAFQQFNTFLDLHTEGHKEPSGSSIN